MKHFLFRWRGAVVAPVALAVVVLARPTADSFLVGLLMSLCGEAIRLWALGYTGQPTRSQHLEAPALVTAGPYSLVRNPLYLGNLLNALGSAMAAAGGLSPAAGLGLLALAAGVLHLVYGACIAVEEEFLATKFGPEYEEYRRRVPALLPRRFAPGPGVGRFQLPSLRYETSTLIWLALVWGVLALKLFVWTPGSTRV